ncbi:MAG: SpoIIE family protein phosphatase [Bacteroidales bacterium]|nr:SpoIIE family protein phosphatase [Bacteroidales bacterium]
MIGRSNYFFKFWRISLFIVLLFLCKIGFQIDAQEGVPFMTNFYIPSGFSPQNWGMVQEEEGAMLFANRRGIVSFNGSGTEGWKYLQTDIIPYSITKDPHTGKIYVGSNSEFGYIERNEFGDFEFVSMAEENTIYGDITDISFTEKAIYFYSSSCIVKINKDIPDDKICIQSKPDELFAGFFIHNSELYVNIKDRGISMEKKNSLIPLPEGNLFDNVSISFFLPFNESQTLVATNNSFLYLFDGTEFKDYIIEDEEYLFNAVVSDGIRLSENQMALTTLTGGCLIVDTETNKTNFILNYQAGLPDDEIYAIASDKGNGLWLTHEFGATRIDLTLPVRVYNVFQGLEGNLSEVIQFNDKVYVSTSEGVFFLQKVRNYSQTIITVESSQLKSQDQIRQEYELDTEPNLAKNGDTKQTKGVKQGLFARLFSKKNNKKSSSLSEKDMSNKNKSEIIESGIIYTPTPSRQKFTRKNLRRLESISYKFSKVANLNAKCKQLISFRGRLLVASNIGLYQIKNNKSELIIGNAYINSIYPSTTNPDRIYVGTETGLETVDFTDESVIINHNFFPVQTPVYSILENDYNLWLGSDTRVIKVKLDNENPVVQNIYGLSSLYSENVFVKEISGEPTFFTSSGIFRFDEEDEEIERINSPLFTNMEFIRYIFPRDGTIWVNDRGTWITLNQKDETESRQVTYLRLFENVRYLQSDANKNLWVIDGHNHISKILYTDSLHIKEKVEVFVESITDQEGKRLKLGSMNLDKADLPLRLSIQTSFYLKPELVEHQYYIENFDQDWRPWTNDRFIEIPFLPPGDYKMHIQARNVLGKISSTVVTDFYIKEPKPAFTDSVWFYLLIAMGILGFLYLIIILRERKLLNDKKFLETKVQERTEEIARQKEEIEKQKDEIIHQKEEITDSISYGKRIQTAILPPKDTLREIMPEFFIYYKPRDIVSGDFYWVSEKDNKVIIAVADCTGHGVPGAFMSILGNSLLDEIRNNYKITTASTILNRLRRNLKVALHQTGRDYETTDGMDMSLCIFDKKSYMLQYAGAYNPMYVIRDGELRIIRGDKMPIGIHYIRETPFTNHKIKLKPNDALYLFTDGYADQFGGPDNKKFKIVRFRNLLLKIHPKLMHQQKKILAKELNTWMGDDDQVDDILIMGLRVK